MVARVYSVLRVGVGTTLVSDGGVPALTVSADGLVNSGGWSNPEFGTWSYVTPPSDGILDLDFLATPPRPDTYVTMGFPPISARAVLAVPDWVVGVRVHAATNSMVSRISEGVGAARAPTANAGTAGGPLWPWPWFRPQSPGAPQTLQPNASILPPFETSLTFPETVYINLMPPVPDRVVIRATATVTVRNNSGRAEQLSAATPCHIHHWDVTDEGNRMVDTEKDDACPAIYMTRELEPGETMRSDYVVALNGKALQDHGRYKLKFKFWGFDAEAPFTARVVQ